MFFVDWKLDCSPLCSPVGSGGYDGHVPRRHQQDGDYYAAGQKMNNTIVEYINGMEVVKVFNRDGESYHRFETDVKNYRDFTLDWFRACWLWMALYTSILPCVALVHPASRRLSGTHRRLHLAGLRTGTVHVFFRGAASDPSHGVSCPPCPS